MVLGATFMSLPQFSGGEFGGKGAVLLPLVLAAVGILTSIIGTFFVKVKDGGDPHKALNLGEYLSAAMMLVLTYISMMI
jgi:K(+)-stimulated pyrophosphate-energized sodium pump